MKRLEKHTVAIKMAQELLKGSIDKKFKFHNYNHTLNVVRGAYTIGFHSGLNSAELELVNLAAWFHDLGYCLNHTNHEELSVKLARKILVAVDINDQGMATICNMIMATQLPQTPKNEMERVLCDADMFHLSQIDYRNSCDLLRTEIELVHSESYTEKEWNTKNIEFFDQHEYFTSFGQKILNPLKAENFKNLCNEQLMVA